jgi:hypothetical protein
MWLADQGRLGPRIIRGWPARKQGSAASRLVTVETNLRSGPSSQPQTGRKALTPHAATNAGSKRHRENGQPRLRLTPQDAANTPSHKGQCPRFSVMHRRRGGEARKRGTEGPGCQAQSPPVSELRRRVPASCPFLRGSRHAPNQSAHDCLRSFRFRPLEPSNRFRPLHLRDHGNERTKQPCLRD